MDNNRSILVWITILLLSAGSIQSQSRSSGIYIYVTCNFRIYLYYKFFFSGGTERGRKRWNVFPWEKFRFKGIHVLGKRLRRSLPLSFVEEIRFFFFFQVSFFPVGGRLRRERDSFPPYNPRGCVIKTWQDCTTSTTKLLYYSSGIGWTTKYRGWLTRTFFFIFLPSYSRSKVEQGPHTSPIGHRWWWRRIVYGKRISCCPGGRVREWGGDPFDNRGGSFK